MPKVDGHFYEFGRFRLSTADRVLLRQGDLVPLTPKVFDILLALVENGGRLVEKEDLMKRVWPDTFVEEGNLTQNISLLRKALGDGTRCAIHRNNPQQRLSVCRPNRRIPGQTGLSTGNLSQKHDGGCRGNGRTTKS